MMAIRGEKGQVLPLVLIAFTLGALLLGPVFTRTRGALADSVRAKGQIKTLYSAEAGGEHAIWQLRYGSGYADSFTPQAPSRSYALSLNGGLTSVTITRIFPWSPPPPNPTPPPGVRGQKIVAAMYVTPQVVDAGEASLFTYTLYIWNIGTSSVHLEEIQDLLPSGFTYAGPSQGVAPYDPVREWIGQQQLLTWTFQRPRPKIESGSFAVQSFQASAVPGPGSYYGIAVVKPDPESMPEAVAQPGDGTYMAVDAVPRRFEILSLAGEANVRAVIDLVQDQATIRSWLID